ncbi:MAG: hypothetical protein PUD72_05665 [Oscillospiraceae bacterium]|nr:hypothetical protein [Oscillospiraceae bacterium]
MKIFNKSLEASVKYEKLLATQYGQSKVTFFVFMFLRAIVIALMILSIIRKRYDIIPMCILTLILFTLPPIFERKFNADLPTFFEVFVLIFIFSAQVLGEIFAFYVKIPIWDTLLHTTSGFMIAAFGFSMIDIMNKDDQLKFKLSPVYTCLNSLGFTALIAMVWEFFEFFMDYFFGMDMQKDTVISRFQSVMLDPTNSNIAVKVENIHEVIIDGNPLPFDGYLDIGLYDTMKDTAVAELGALVFCVFAFAFIKTKGKNKIAAMFIPVKRNWDENPPDYEFDYAKRLQELEAEFEKRKEEMEAELEAEKEKIRSKNVDEKKD